MINDEIELAWAAGFFDGEGSVPNFVGRSGRPGSPMVTITQASNDDSVPDTLTRFAAAVEVPCRIYGPTLVAGRKPRYVLQVGKYEDVKQLRDSLYPFLSSAKRADFDRQFDLHSDVRENPRPKNVPKTHCHKGHERTEENAYWSNGKRICKPCQKERALKQRELERAAKAANS